MCTPYNDAGITKNSFNVLDEIEDGYLELDIVGHIIFANRAFSKIIGYPRETLTGMDYRDYMDAKSAEKCFKAFNKVYNTGRPEPSFVYEMTRKDNKKRFVEYSISLLKDASEDPIGFRCIIRDVTTKKIASEQIAKQRALLEATFRSVQDGIITVDTQGRIIEANQSAYNICNVQLDDTRNLHFYSCFTHCSKACHEALSKTLSTSQAVQEFQVECKHHKKLTQQVKVVSSPLLDDQQQVIGAVIVIRDITRLMDLEKELCKRSHYKNIIGKSKKMMNVFTIIERLSEVDTTVLITGESGTGKEMVARALHQSGHRAFDPMVTVNCAALSENLLESELFGHAKGAFTGAVQDSIGRFQMADKGTIFLDEIGDISPKIQVKLLRVLQEKTFERVGDSKSIHSDVRIIAATNQNLKLKVDRGEFRLDLYYRINVVELELPPLRERNDDISLLIDHFCRILRKKYRKPSHRLSENVLRKLLEYDWPGNVRELEHTMERLFVLSGARENIPSDLLPKEVSGITPDPDRRPTSETRQEDIEKALASTDWNISKAARQLGINRRTIYRKIKKHGIQRPNSQ